MFSTGSSQNAYMSFSSIMWYSSCQNHFPASWFFRIIKYVWDTIAKSEILCWSCSGNVNFFIQSDNEQFTSTDAYNLRSRKNRPSEGIKDIFMARLHGYSKQNGVNTTGYYKDMNKWCSAVISAQSRRRGGHCFLLYLSLLYFLSFFLLRFLIDEGFWPTVSRNRSFLPWYTRGSLQEKNLVSIKWGCSVAGHEGTCVSLLVLAPAFGEGELIHTKMTVIIQWQNKWW